MKSNREMGVAILGCGLIGQKRAKALNGARLVVCADSDLPKAEALAKASPGALASKDWRTSLTLPGVDIVIASATNNMLAEMTQAAMIAGKHVLVEKPGSRSREELEVTVGVWKKSKIHLAVGFNHRFHPGILKAREILDSGELGEPMFVRGRYGHGGRLGYEKEWRADPKKSGGGELIDQGVHLIDLARWFLGDFSEVSGFARTFFWNMPVDDNAFLVLNTIQRQTAFLHVSCTEWKNLFSFEIYGRKGKLHIEGLGGSYGVERLTYYRMLPQMGPPETTLWEYPQEDSSWQLEFDEFLRGVETGRSKGAGIMDAYFAMQIVEKIYLESGYDYRA
jgi:predicted dehydrogenase